MDLKQAIQSFQTILDNTSPDSKVEFYVWLKNHLDQQSCIISINQQSEVTNRDRILEGIKDEIQQLLPITATSNTETLLVPISGPNADCDPAVTVHVDAFLYDESDIDELVDQGKLSRHFCSKCKSCEVENLNFITHSSSIKQIKYIFQYLLPDLSCKTVLDVGSRTGAVLYGAALYTNARRIVGVEIDPTFCQLQKHITEKYNLSDKIQIIQDDISNQGQLITECDVIIMNNVFEFFLSKNDQERVWRFIRNTCRRKGVVLITGPSLEESLENLETGIDLGSWVSCLNNADVLKSANIHLYGSADNDESDLDYLHIYEVIG